MNAMQVAARFYEARDICRRLWGAEYARKIGPWMEQLRSVMIRHELQALDAAKTLLEYYNQHGNGFAMMFVLAACVELIEPSEPSPCGDHVRCGEGIACDGCASAPAGDDGEEFTG